MPGHGRDDHRRIVLLRKRHEPTLVRETWTSLSTIVYLPHSCRNDSAAEALASLCAVAEFASRRHMHPRRGVITISTQAIAGHIAGQKPTRRLFVIQRRRARLRRNASW